jgi:hypothetical protein
MQKVLNEVLHLSIISLVVIKVALNFSGAFHEAVGDAPHGMELLHFGDDVMAAAEELRKKLNFLHVFGMES